MKNLLEDSYEPYSYFLKTKTAVKKANPYHDERGRFTSADKAAAPKGAEQKGKIKTVKTLDSEYYSHTGYKALPKPTDDLEIAKTTGAPIRWLMPQSMAEPLAKLYDEYVLRRSDTRSPNSPDPADFHNALIVELENLGVADSYERRIIADGILRRANFHAKERAEFSLDASQQIIDQALGGVAEIPRWDKQTKEGVFGEIGDEFVGIHIWNDNLKKVMDDGRYKTQFESGISGGMLDTDRRAGQEVAMFSLHPSLSGEKRPVYGQIYTDGFSMDSWREAGQYGQTVLVLKKPNHKRTSYTSGDSLGRTVQSSSMKTPSFHGGDKQELGNTGLFGGSDLAYIEAQIHGGVKVSDISHIIIPSDGGVGPNRFREKYNIPSSIKIIHMNNLADGDKIHKALVSNTPADAILSAMNGNIKLYVSLKNKDVGYVETEEGLVYKVNPHDVFARGYWKPYTIRERLKKANPHHDARGRFTTKTKAVAPKGKKPKLKRAGSDKKSSAANTIAEAEQSLKDAGVTLRIITLPSSEAKATKLSKELEKNFFQGSSIVSAKLFPDGFQDQWFISAHNLIQKCLRFGNNVTVATTMREAMASRGIPRAAKLKAKGTRIIIAEVNGKIVGAMRYERWDGEIPYAGSFRVANGIGSAMFGQVVRIAAQSGGRIQIEALTSAKGFWEKMGFREERPSSSYERQVQIEQEGTVNMSMSPEDVAKLAEQLP